MLVDSVLDAHLSNHAKNASYIPKTSQNELISIIGEQIQDRIVKDMKTAKLFSICADEMTDI